MAKDDFDLKPLREAIEALATLESASSEDDYEILLAIGALTRIVRRREGRICIKVDGRAYWVTATEADALASRIARIEADDDAD